MREVICIRRQGILPIVAYVAEKYAPNLCSGNDGQLVTILLQLQLMGVKNDDLPEAVPLGELRSCMRAVNVPPSPGADRIAHVLTLLTDFSVRLIHANLQRLAQLHRAN